MLPVETKKECERSIRVPRVKSQRAKPNIPNAPALVRKHSELKITSDRN